MKNPRIPMYVILLASFLAGCATNELSPSAQNTSIDSRNGALDYATDLVIKEKEKFRSAYLLASQRPRVIQEIQEFQFGVSSDDGAGEVDSVARFSPLPGGLQYFEHTQPSPLEASIDVFGIASVLYWNGRIPYPSLSAPKKVSLTSGRLFSLDSPFTLESKDEYVFIVETCEPLETIPAHNIHKKLTGSAAVFECKAPPWDAKYKLWYLADYARYVNFETYIDGQLLTSIRIKDVKFR